MSIQFALNPAVRDLNGQPHASRYSNSAVKDASDDELLRRCGCLDQSALEELARRYQGPLFRFLYRLMGSEEEAEEAVLDVFVRAWRSAGRFEYRAKVATWLYRIANNVARDAYDRKRVRPNEVPLEVIDNSHLRASSAEDEALTSVHRAEQSKLVRQALAMLSDSDRLILVLYYLEDREYEEIQAIAGVSRCVLKTRLVRARRRLRSAMESLA